MTCLRCQHGTAKKFGTYGKLRIQRYRCNSCRATFTQPRHKPLGRHYSETAKAAQIATLLLEGMTVRPGSRITGVHQCTILSLLLTVGDKNWNPFDKRVRNVRPNYIQADGLWTFVHTKEAHLYGDAPKE